VRRQSFDSSSEYLKTRLLQLLARLHRGRFTEDCAADLGAIIRSVKRKPPVLPIFATLVMQGGGMGTGKSSADFGYQGGDVDSGSTLGITTRSGLVLRAGSSLRPGGADGAGEVHSHGYSSGISQQHGLSFQKEPHVLVQSGGLQGMPLPQSLMQQGSERLQLNISTRSADATGASRTHVRPIHKYHMVKNESSVASIGVHERQQQCNANIVSYVCTLAA